MAKVYFYYAAMNAGKSTALLQASYNYQERGMRTLVFAPAIDTRAGVGHVRSRIGLEGPALTLERTDDLFARVQTEHTATRVACVLVDEAWLLMREPAGAGFLYRLAKSARKRWCGLTTITQDAGDLLATELGQAIIANADNHILLRQAPQAIERLAEAFRLTDGERRYLLTCPRGHGLFIVGDDRFPLQVLASPGEHALATSDPAELAPATAA